MKANSLWWADSLATPKNRPASPRRRTFARLRPLRLEALEPRTLLDGPGVVSGALFHDLNRDGVRGAGESALAGWAVELQPCGSTDIPLLTIKNPTPDEWSQFGRFVEAVGNNVLVGSHYDDIAGPPDAGAAYLFDGANGQLLQVFQSPDPQESAKFGRALAAIGNKVLIGAPAEDAPTGDSGVVYMFDAQTGLLLRTFKSPAGGANDQFGRAIATLGDRVLIGARYDDTAAENAGAAYLFDSNTGELLRTFVSPNLTANAEFGYTIAAMGDNILIAARYDETGANGVGAVYLFDGRTGNLLQSFLNPTQRATDEASDFGHSIAAAGNNVLVGARWDDSAVDGAGAAFVFDGATGELLHTLVSPTPFAGEEFGMCVAALRNDLLVGARWDNRWDNLGQQSGGAAYLFDSATGQLLQTFANPSPGAWDAFGIWVSPLGDNRLIVGAQDGNAAYVFSASAERARVLADAQGSYCFTGLEPGVYRLVVSGRDGYAQTPSGSSTTHMITITVDDSQREIDFGFAPNAAPVGQYECYTVAEDGWLELSAAQGVLANDSDADGDPLTARLVNQPPHGTVVMSADGAFRYAPDRDFAGSDSFTYRAFDGLSDSVLITVTITVTPVNDAPVACDNGVWVLINSPRMSPAPGVLADDIDGDGDTLTASLLTPPSHGTVQLAADGSYTYTPYPDYAGPDSFTYRASDGVAESNVATVHITVSVTTPDALLDYLRITELNYNPYTPTAQERAAGFVNRDDFEFVELRNIGSTRLEMVGVRLVGAVDFAFPGLVWLDAGQYGLLVRNQAAFESRYGTRLNVLGQYNGDLHNSGERLILRDPFDRTITEFSYDDEGTWPLSADGFGASLEVLCANGGDYGSPANWRASAEYGGSPCGQGSGATNTVVINEVLTHANLPMTDAIELYNVTDVEIDVSGWYLSDSANDFKKFRIPDGTAIAAHGYLVFDEHDFNPERWDPGAGGFAFDSALGDDVWLMAADADGTLTRFVDHVEFAASLNGESFSRWPNGTGDLYSVRNVTLGSANSQPLVRATVISEVMYAPPSSGANTDTRNFQFIEIYNPTTDTIDLRNWEIRGGLNYNFPESDSAQEIWFAPSETILVVGFNPNDNAALTAFRNYYSINGSVRLFGPFSGSLNREGDSVRLMRADAPAWWEPDLIPRVLEDEVTYDNESPWPVSAAGCGYSLYRREVDLLGRSVESWGAAMPSPGAVDLQVGVLAITEINFHPFDPTAAELSVNANFVSNDFEFLEVLNVSGKVVNLGGMRLTSAAGFDFPSTSLAIGERAVIVSNLAAFQARYGKGINVLGEFIRNLADGGERIILLGSAGQMLLSFVYDNSAPWPERADGNGSSLELINVYSEYGEGASWRASTEYGGSPGWAGIGAIKEIVINEVLAVADTPSTDRVELHNRTRGRIDVSGWYLSDSGSTPEKFRIPDGTVIEPHGYVVFDGTDLAPPLGGQGFAFDPFSINNVYLFQTDTQGRVTCFADHAWFGPTSGRETWGRWPNGTGDLYPMVSATLEPETGDNSGPRVGPVVISEVMYHPRDPGDVVEPNDLEYLEIYNPTDQAVDLSGWQLRGGAQFEFPNGTLLDPREALLVTPFDTKDIYNATPLRTFELHYGIKPWVDILGGFSGSLSNRGDRVQLLRVGSSPADDRNLVPLVLEDEIIFDDESPWPDTADGYGWSLHRAGVERWGNDVTSWVAAPPSPGMVEARNDRLAITELNYHPYAPTAAELAVNPAFTADDFEFIEVLNVSGGPLDLSGMSFSEGVQFTFPNLTLTPAERMLIVKNPAAFAARYGATGVLVAGPYLDTLSDNGEQVTLNDPSTSLRFTYGDAGDWPSRADGFGSSLELLDLAGYYNDANNWRASGPYGGTPGGVAEGLRRDVVINEILARPTAPAVDAVELRNMTNQPIDVGGWYLSNDSANYRKFRIPDHTVLPARGYLVFDGRDFSPTIFSLKDDGGEVWLLEAVGGGLARFVDQVQYGMAAAGRSFGRWPDGTGQFMTLVAPTLDRAHPEQGCNRPAQTPGALVVTELNFNPLMDDEFIELYNTSPFPYDLTALRFTVGITYDFATSPVTELGPSEYLVIARNPAAIQARYGAGIRVVGPYGGALSNQGERVVLETASGDAVLDFWYSESGPTEWADGGGASLELIDPTAVPQPGPLRTEFLQDPANWRASGRLGGSPGEAGESPCGDVLINEVLASGAGPARIELFNTTDVSVDMEGWQLWHGGESFVIPQGTVIPVGGYLTFDQSQFGFRISQPGRLWLLASEQPGKQPTGIDRVAFSGAALNESLGRWPDAEGGLYPMRQPTWGYENSSPRIGPLVISEVHYNSNEIGGADDLEFVEIYNPTSAVVDVFGWRLTGGIDYWLGGTGQTQLSPFGTMVVLSFNPNSSSNADRVRTFRAAHGIDAAVPLCGGYTGGLGNGGDGLSLLRPDGVLEDAVSYDDRAPWSTRADGRGASLNRRGIQLWGSEATSWIAATPTPGWAPLLQPPHTMTWTGQADGTWDSPNWTGSPPSCPDATANTVLNTPHTITVDSVQEANSLSVAGGGRVAIAGGGTLTAINGVTVGAGGTLEVLAGGTLTLGSLTKGADSANLRIDGGTLKAVASFAMTMPITLKGAGATVNTNGFDLVLMAPVTGIAEGGALNKTGAGTLILSGANIYTGGTHVSAGTLQVISPHALPAGKSLSIGAGATLVLASGLNQVSGQVQGVDMNGAFPIARNQADASARVAQLSSDTATSVPLATVPAGSVTGGNSMAVESGTVRIDRGDALTPGISFSVGAGGTVVLASGLPAFGASDGIAIVAAGALAEPDRCQDKEQDARPKTTAFALTKTSPAVVPPATAVAATAPDALHAPSSSTVGNAVFQAASQEAFRDQLTWLWESVLARRSTKRDAFVPVVVDQILATAWC